MIESGIIVCMGLVMWFIKTKWSTRMWILSHGLFIDIVVFVTLTALHWGTYTGVMAATVGALMCSILISLGRKVWGYNEKGKYIRGMYDVSHKLKGV